MKRVYMTCFITLILLLFSFKLYSGINYNINFTSRYIWRGMDMLYDNNAALQLSLTYSFGNSGFSTSVFSSIALTNRSELKSLDEIDFNINYDFNISDRILVSIGMNNYGYYFIPNYSFKKGNTQDFYISAILNKILFKPKISIYYDINLGNGLYMAVEAGHILALSESIKFDVDISIGYNGKQWVNDYGLSDLLIGVSLPITLKKIKVSPYIKYTHVFLGALNTDKDEIWFGLSFSL